MPSAIEFMPRLGILIFNRMQAPRRERERWRAPIMPTLGRRLYTPKVEGSSPVGPAGDALNGVRDAMTCGIMISTLPE